MYHNKKTVFQKVLVLKSSSLID